MWSRADRVGLLGTLVVPEGAAGHYFVGREGTKIGPRPWRHDAQVSMGPETVGRIVFVADDAASLSRGAGKRIKGEMWADSSRANKDTELGHETVQFRPVIAVDCGGRDAARRRVLEHGGARFNEVLREGGYVLYLRR